MALRDQTLNEALKVIEDVLKADLQTQLDLDNTKYGWSLQAPSTYFRGQQATVGHTQTPALLLYSNLETINPGAFANGDHTFQVVFSLAIGAKDVKSGANNQDLYDAIVLYGSRMMLVLTNDFTAIDPTSKLRNIGVWNMQDGVSFFDPVEPGTTTSASFITARFTAKFTQRRAQSTS